MSRQYLVTLMMFGLIATVSLRPAYAEDLPPDVRVLIDVSGSMKKNDPLNLRVPALKLIVNLLPKDAKAGVWLFAEDVQALVEHRSVDASWQKEAEASASKIHSRGQFTDIDLAIMTATRDWIKEPDQGNRSVIVLTDGVVDVSKDPIKSEESRKQLLRLTLPRLRSLGARIHTIALSENADLELMKALATQTDGAYEQTNNATELQRIFLRLFEKSVKRDTLPLKGNKFQVDGSIEELTLLAFKKEGAPPTQLVSPSGVEYSAVAPKDNSRWHTEDSYDLITVSNPEVGEWRLIAEVDPDNRVMIVSDLKMRHDELPNNVISGENFELNISLTEDGKVIDRPAFLDKMRVAVTQTNPEGETWDWVLADDGIGDDKQAKDGIYTMSFGDNLVSGKNEIRIEVDGKTFQRQRQFVVEVHPTPFKKIEAKQKFVDTKRNIRIDLSEPLEWIRPDSIKVGARVTDPDGKTHFTKLRHESNSMWVLEARDVDPKGEYVANLELVGLTKRDRKLRVKLEPVTIKPDDQPMAEESKVEAPEPVVEAKPPPPAEPEQPEPEETNWWFVIGMVIGVNALLFGSLGTGYYFYAKKNGKDAPDVTSDNDDDDDPADEKNDKENEEEPNKDDSDKEQDQ